jgi:hypothetical protein
MKLSIVFGNTLPREIERDKRLPGTPLAGEQCHAALRHQVLDQPAQCSGGCLAVTLRWGQTDIRLGFGLGLGLGLLASLPARIAVVVRVPDLFVVRLVAPDTTHHLNARRLAHP